MGVGPSVCFVLHSHLPFVMGHGSWPHGADWLNEAAAETYLPLLRVFSELVEEGVKPAVTVGLTPVLCEQLGSDAFKRSFLEYLDRMISSAEADAESFAGQGNASRAAVARTWRDHYARVRGDFTDRFDGDIVGAFRALQDAGHIEVITSAATHGYLPLLGTDESVQAQLTQGVVAYERHFGRKPRGIWLPECAYRPRYEWAPPVDGGEPFLRKGLEEFLSELGLEYFIVDSHLLAGGEAIGVYLDRFSALRELWERFREKSSSPSLPTGHSPYRLHYVGPVRDGQAPVAIFTRDPKTAVQVWSGEHGYPGDEWYLDFHKKHFPSGLRYWRVTGPKTDMAEKLEYDPDRADERIRSHADHFADVAAGVLSEASTECDGSPVLCAPFDAELFGHWWFEGPGWLGGVIRRLHRLGVPTRTCSEVLDAQPPHTVVSLPEGSWGKGGFHWIWLNDWTEWTWRHVYEAERRMVRIAGRYPEVTDEHLKGAIKQLARELMLLESSDWQFLISTWSARDYAELRVSDHFEAFCRIADMIEKAPGISDADRAFLAWRMERDALFPDVDPLWWARVRHPAS